MSYNLVVSSKSQYLYYSIPKIATTSIKIYLEKYTLIDIGSLTLENGYGLEYSSEWDNYFKFAFVRNPWDRILSCFLDKTKQCIGKNWELEYYKRYYDCSFEEFVDKLTNKNIMYDGHLIPQSIMINLDRIDYIGKFENLKQDIIFIQEKLDLPKKEITFENTTCHEHYTEYYNKKSIDKIYQIYKSDIDNFNYEF